jgi:protease I
MEDSTMKNSLQQQRIAIIATDGFEQSELEEPKRQLEQSGAKVDVIAPHGNAIKGWDMKQWGRDVRVDKTFAQANAADYDALVIPGGVINPDKLRLEHSAVEFIRQFAAQEKPIAAICHGPQMLIEAGLVQGRQLTSWPSLRTDLTNAGAKWVDREVVQDDTLITSRKPDDIPAFVSTLQNTLQARAGTQHRAA